MIAPAVGRTSSNKAEYSASDAPSSRLREGVTDRRTDGRTDTPSYRDATAHLKRMSSNDDDLFQLGLNSAHVLVRDRLILVDQRQCF